MGFEWDENKRIATLKARGLDFGRAARIFDGFVLEWENPRYGEHRIVAVGQVEDDYLTVVYTWRGTRRRIISARAARKAERQRYEQARRADH